MGGGLIARSRETLAATACALAISALALARLANPLDAATIQPALQVAGDDSLAVVVDDAGIATAAVTVVNPSDIAANLTAELGASAATAGVRVLIADTSIPPMDARSIPLRFETTLGFAGFAGDLVFRAAGLTPAVLPVTILLPARQLPFGDATVLAGAFVAGIAFVLIRVATLRGHYDRRAKLGGVHWDFGSSWATNLTTVGAILASVRGSGVIAGESGVLSSDVLTGLSLFFGTLVILAAFSYVVSAQVIRDEEGNQTRQGSVTSFLVAATLTIIAVIGQMSVLALLIVDQLRIKPTDAVAWGLLGLVVVAGVLVLFHSWTSIRWTLELLAPPAPPKGARPGPPVPAGPPKGWSLL